MVHTDRRKHRRPAGGRPSCRHVDQLDVFRHRHRVQRHLLYDFHPSDLFQSSISGEIDADLFHFACASGDRVHRLHQNDGRIRHVRLRFDRLCVVFRIFVLVPIAPLFYHPVFRIMVGVHLPERGGHKRRHPLPATYRRHRLGNHLPLASRRTHYTHRLCIL